MTETVIDKTRGAATHFVRGKRLLPFVTALVAFALLVIPLFQEWASLTRPFEPTSVVNARQISNLTSSPHFIILGPVGYASPQELAPFLETAETRRRAIMNHIGMPENNRTISMYVDPTRTIFEGASFDTILVGDIKGGAGCIAHEMLHVFDTGSNSFFNEGLAEHIEGKFGWGDCGFTTSHNRDAHLYSLLRKGWTMLPLESLMQTRMMQLTDSNSYLRYEQAGSFVDFLVARYGITRFMEFFHANAFSNDAIDAAMKNHFGRGLNELDAEWLGSLRLGNFLQTVALMGGTLALLGAGVMTIRRGRAYLPGVVLGALALLSWTLHWFYPLEFVSVLFVGILLGLLVGIWFKRVGTFFVVALGIVSLVIWIVMPLVRVGL